MTLLGTEARKMNPSTKATVTGFGGGVEPSRTDHRGLRRLGRFGNLGSNHLWAVSCDRAGPGVKFLSLKVGFAIKLFPHLPGAKAGRRAPSLMY